MCGPRLGLFGLINQNLPDKVVGRPFDINRVKHLENLCVHSKPFIVDGVACWQVVLAPGPFGWQEASIQVCASRSRLSLSVVAC